MIHYDEIGHQIGMLVEAKLKHIDSLSDGDASLPRNVIGKKHNDNLQIC